MSKKSKALRATINADDFWSRQEKHDAQLVKIYEAAATLSRAMRDLEFLHDDFIAAGYGLPPSDHMPLLVPREALMLGRETDPDSHISQLRRQLEGRGLI